MSIFSSTVSKNQTKTKTQTQKQSENNTLATPALSIHWEYRWAGEIWGWGAGPLTEGHWDLLLSLYSVKSKLD